MERILNTELDTLVMKHLTERFNLTHHRPVGEFHLSSAVYCITRAFWESTAPCDPTDEELMLFALGYGLQDVITPTGATAPTYIKDNIIYRPDFILKVGDTELGEIKTSRMSMKTLVAALPETWECYIKGGCYIREQLTYNLSVLLLMGNYAPPFPKLRSETLTFTSEEIADNWDRILERKMAYDVAIRDGTPPTPYQYCYDFECKNCRYGLMCEAVAGKK
jgi:hypothetical protein